MNQKYTVIYHRLDWDGILSGAAALYWLVTKQGVPREDINMVGYDYHDKDFQNVPPDHILYMLDISCKPLMAHPKLIWIDHHKSAIEEYDQSIPGYRIDGVAACRLTWQYFWQKARLGHAEPINIEAMPSSAAPYIDRIVNEPTIIRLAGEYDIWDKRDPRAEWLQHGLTLGGYTVEDGLCQEFWEIPAVGTMIDRGDTIDKYVKVKNTQVAEAQAFLVNWEGLRFLALNQALGNSLSLGQVAHRLDPHYDAIMLWRFDGHQARFSLYSKPSGTDADLSVIAVKHGGGGHKGACGFAVELDYAAAVIFKRMHCMTLSDYEALIAVPGLSDAIVTGLDPKVYPPFEDSTEATHSEPVLDHTS